MSAIALGPAYRPPLNKRLIFRSGGTLSVPADFGQIGTGVIARSASRGLT